MSWNGATLAERLAYVRGRAEDSAETRDAPDGGDDRLAPWARACALGDVEALLRRLSWDGIDPGVARAAMAAEAPGRGFPVAAWLNRLPDLVADASSCAAAVGTPEWDEDVEAVGADLPFVDAWVPVLRAARRQLDRAVPTCRAVLSDESIRALERHLVNGISRLGELALFEDFRGVSVPPRAGVSSDGYLSFIRNVLASRYEAFLLSYPVLARQIVSLVDQWVDEIAALTSRLEEDRAAIKFTFGAAAGQVRRLTPGLSDRHAGGRQVAFVEFASGLRLAYKPRDVRLERVFNEWLHWLRRSGLAVAPRPLRVLDRGTYGWIEWAEQGSLGSSAAAHDYFRSAGALVCVAYVLGGSDLHSENLVASSEGPVLVDTEMLLQPSTRPGRPSDAGTDESSSDPTSESCLASGLVSAIVVDRARKAYDVGGLRPAVSRELAVPMRSWVNLRNDDITFVPEHRVHPVLRNDVRVNGHDQRLEDFVDDVCAGFELAYQFFESNRAALMAVDGPLRGFADCPVRVLFRPSDQYAAAQYVMAAPRYQRRGLERSLAIETFHRVFISGTERPRIWQLVHDERQALEGLDIPRATLLASATDVTASTGAEVRNFYARSGVAAMRGRLSGLSAKEMARQVDQLRAALDSAGVSSPAPRGAADEEEESLCAAAECVGRVLLGRAHQESDGSLRWLSSSGRADLYAGASGIGLFFAALAGVTGRTIWRDAAEQTLRAIDGETPGARDPGVLRIGACTGRPSVAYAVALAGYLLDDSLMMDRAREFAWTIPPDAIDRDVVLDIEGGAAGALVALLAVHDVRPDGRLIAMARRCVSRLLATQLRSGPDRGAWSAGDEPCARPGFAHGAAGIASALCRWASHAGDAGVFDAVRSAWDFERRIFADSAGAWPTARGDGGLVVMAAWCHGAPGIALARTSAPVEVADAHVAGEIEAAMHQTLSAPEAQLDHLCCGNLGRADIALTVGLRTAAPPWVDRGLAMTRAVAARVLTQQRLGMRGRGFHRGAPVPEFFQGLAGIGYSLLRASSPSVLPSVLAFDSPAGERPVGSHTKEGQS